MAALAHAPRQVKPTKMSETQGKPIEITWTEVTKVRKTPCRPRSWANFSRLSLYSHIGMHGPTCIFWANLTPFALKRLRQIDMVYI